MGSKSAIGIGNGICFKQVRDKGGGSYIDPLVRDSLVGVWIADRNTNESPTRNIIKNTIKDKGGDLELLNFAYKANSGYNGYPEDFTTWRNSSHLQVEYSTDGSKFKITSENIKDWWLIAPNNGISNSFKVKITNCHFPIVWRYTDDGNTYKDITIREDGIYNLPQSIINNEGVVNRCYFGSGTQRSDYTGLTIEQLPLYEGALVTDGKDDMIVSQKTVQEMGITNEITVVSMIHQIGIRSEYNRAFNNYIRNQNVGFIRNNIAGVGIDKTGIYGYTWNNSTKSVINNILGDKNDYSIEVGNSVGIEGKFTVEGYIKNGSPDEISGVAVYWTFIANKVLTTDEINQIIAYFKLDKYVTPQVIYDVKRQGLTNDTPAADWYLKDFSGNGHDMQLYNYAKKLDSGVGKYATDFLNWKSSSDVQKTSSEIKITSSNYKEYWIAYVSPNTNLKAITVHISGIPNNAVLKFSGTNNGDIKMINGINKIPAFTVTAIAGFYINKPLGFDWSKLIIIQIPDYEGALVSDGKDDYGKAEGLPIFKDYTVAADRAWINLVGARNECLSTKNSDPDFGAFNFELSEGIGRNTFSFGNTNQVSIDVDRKISYQSKYSYNGAAIAAGNIVDGKDLFLFRSRSAFPYYAEAAIWSYILFPYTLSEFLLERQLKKYKLGTLYPDMVEFRPVVKSSSEYQVVDFYIDNLPAVVGKYYPINSALRIAITTQGQVDEVSSIKVNGVDFGVPSINGNRFTFNGTLSDKSPQKIDITIDEYIRFEDIAQPYPEIWTITQNGNKVSWGDKLKVGSEFGYNSKVNLLSDVYATANSYYNKKVVKEGDILKVEKQMTFACNRRWKLNTTEPHAIYSPQKLNIPNSSLKILGYVPDLTGKGNHGKLNNFAYAGMSGANGYVEDFTKWRISKSNIVSTISDSSIHFTHIGVNYEQTTAIFETQATSNKKYNIKVRISGLTSNMRCFFNNTDEHSLQELVNGVNEISVDLIVGWYGFNINTLDGSVIGDCDITIQQIGEHEGSICFDGTDDHITIPTLAHGGKCVMMKVNWSNETGTIYDQRVTDSGEFAIFLSENNLDNEIVPAYGSRNNGNTYIDGILNTSILTSQLKSITHNITIINDKVALENTASPFIGCKSAAIGFFAKMTMYEFMLFPEIPSEDEIKKLNDAMGLH